MIPRSVTVNGNYVEVRWLCDPYAPGDRWFRVEDRRYANYDPWAEFGQPSGSHLVLVVHSYALLRHTPRGVWLSSPTEKFFVKGTSTKQRAVPTIDLAIADLIARKKHHVIKSQYRLSRAEEHLTAAENLAAAM